MWVTFIVAFGIFIGSLAATATALDVSLRGHRSFLEKTLLNDKRARAVANPHVEAPVAAIFISHSSKDRTLALRVCKALEERGLPCWLSFRDIGPGENFQQAIVGAIRAARVMVLIFTKHANSSSEIRKELAIASQLGIRVIPARIENVNPSEAALVYELSTRQWIDLFESWDDEIERLALTATADADCVLPKPSPK